MRLKYYFVGGVFLLVSGLSGCAQDASYKYGHRAGKKNPRIKLVPSTAKDRAKPPSSRPSIRKRNVKFHYVSKGETLYSIAWQHGHDVRELASWNRIRWPYTIYPKQKLRVKPPNLAQKPSITRSSKPIRQSSKRKLIKKGSQKSKTSQKVKKTWPISWQWPTKGRVIGTFSAKERGKKGLDIAGKKGQPVYAASGGQVVYSGDGLRGYGNLVIIKHNETYFSAYAHNHHLYVKEKQDVKKGQHIADMGSSEAQRAMLHFEVRRNGKPVDPKRYLPKRR